MIPEENVEAMQTAVDGDVQAAYRRLLDADNGFEEMDDKAYEEIAKLKKLTGIGISEKFVNDCYRHDFEQGWIDSPWRLYECTKIRPKRIGAAVQKAYAKFFDRGNAESILDTYEITKVRPKNVSNKRAQTVYERCIGRCAFERIRKIRRLTGIRPEITDEMVQKVYGDIFCDMSFPYDNAKQLLELTKIRPSEETVQKIYGRIIELEKRWDASERDFRRIDILKAFSGIEPDPALLKKYKVSKKDLQAGSR